MAKNCFGADIGSHALKLVLCSGGRPSRVVIEPMPENIVRGEKIVAPAAMVDFLREVSKKHHLHGGRCRLSLPSSVAFTRQLNLPQMSVEHLKLNLPYEFHDFITEDKDKYFYDYLVEDLHPEEDGKAATMDLMASAIAKSTVHEYADMFRRAGLHLDTLLPEEYAYRNVVRAHAQANGGQPSPTECCFIDLGHSSTRLFIFNGLHLAATRVVNYGGALIDEAIAEQFNVDPHLAQTYKHSNYENVQFGERCQAVYARIAVEISRAVNFYSFNNPQSNLTDCYFCGGGVHIPQLTQAISQALTLPTHSALELYPDSAQAEPEMAVTPAALGVILQ